jgi:hypothetical protein
MEALEISIADIAILAALILQWASSALRDRKVSKEEWADLLEAVMHRLVTDLSARNGDNGRG